MHKSEESNVENYVTDGQPDRQTDRGSWFRWSGGQEGSYITPSPLGSNSTINYEYNWLKK